MHYLQVMRGEGYSKRGEGYIYREERDISRDIVSGHIEIFNLSLVRLRTKSIKIKLPSGCGCLHF